MYDRKAEAVRTGRISVFLSIYSYHLLLTVLFRLLPGSPYIIMAVARPRPYRHILTTTLHRRFVHASALSLLVCYLAAFLLGEKSSCE